MILCEWSYASVGRNFRKFFLCRLSLQIPALFQAKACILPHMFSDGLFLSNCRSSGKIHLKNLSYKDVFLLLLFLYYLFGIKSLVGTLKIIPHLQPSGFKYILIFRSKPFKPQPSKAADACTAYILKHPSFQVSWFSITQTTSGVCLIAPLKPIKLKRITVLSSKHEEHERLH